MNPTARFLEVVAALQHAGCQALVMGGHAVRHYGVDRNTLDFDFHVSIQTAGQLESRLLSSGLFAEGVIEGPSWRRDDFRRFRIGLLPDGREEWLEFWMRNHLLEPFPKLWARREEASFGDVNASFLSLPDLIHSKETERESDWQDAALLEEILDLRRLREANDDAGKLAVLSGLRSRRGFERVIAAGIAGDPSLVRRAFAMANCIITLAFLLPFAPDAELTAPGEQGGWELLEMPLRQVVPGSARHLALAEAARRLHKQAAMAADRRDKEQQITR